MAKIELKQIDKNNKAEIIEALQNYKRKNPVKFEAKKEELFKRYGLSEDTTVDEAKDKTDKVLEKKLKEVI